MLISVRAVPNSRKSSISNTARGGYRVKIDAAAHGNRANERLVEILAEHFGVRKSSITIVKGAHSRDKSVEIAGM